jgi:hypothetical protein
MACRLLAAVLLGACATERHVVVESSLPARVTDNGGRVVCERTPCTWTVSRETCFGLDSSSGFVLLTARTPEGVEAHSPAWRTCSLEEGQHLFIELPVAQGPRQHSTPDSPR